MEKEFDLGIVVGRFQTFHKGHQDVMNKAIALCKTVGVFIGSAQESGTRQNPFSYETRKGILKKIYGGAIEIYPLADIGVGNNSRWGDYVLDQVKKRFERYPDLLVSGKETRRVDWFDSVQGLSIAELYIPKTIDISASKMREWLVEDNFDAWKMFCDPRLWEDFPHLRSMVLLSQNSTETASI